MKNWLVWSFVAAVCAVSLSPALKADDPKPPRTVTPVPRPDPGWQKRQQMINERAKEGNVDLIFIGDSITQGWHPMAGVWKKYYGKRNAMNAGIGGDQTQHVLYRLENGNLENIKPKLAVIMIGTNNAGSDSAEEIAAGIKAIVKKIREMRPETKILVLGVFPRSPKPDKTREKLTKVNEIISKEADGKMVHYLDIGPKFLEADGSISPDIMYDYLHLTDTGYAIWGEAIESKVAELMGEK
ncbi:MAG: platelet-activating factor acetylhydrolase IB subunit [Planctomycetales bacterium]